MLSLHSMTCNDIVPHGTGVLTPCGSALIWLLVCVVPWQVPVKDVHVGAVANGHVYVGAVANGRGPGACGDVRCYEVGSRIPGTCMSTPCSIPLWNNRCISDTPLVHQ